MRPEDWEAVRAIYLEGIATGNSTFEHIGAGLANLGPRPFAHLAGWWRASEAKSWAGLR